MRLTIQLGDPTPEPTLHVRLSGVMAGGEPWQAGAIWNEFKKVQTWWYEQFNMALYLPKVMHYIRLDEGITDDYHTHVFRYYGLDYPCLSFDARKRLDNGNDYGRDFGQFAIVAYDNDWWLEVAKHELLHLMSLKHDDKTIMHPHIEQGSKLPVAPYQREAVRQHVLRYL